MGDLRAEAQEHFAQIPESGNGTPDILNEARCNLEWMLKMQDDDGGAWHKQTSEHFPGFVAPEDDKLPSEVIGTGAAPYKSTCATADLAAVGAIAARSYKPYDAKFAARALEAARRAWAWTEKNPNVTFKNPAGVSTGEYGDASCKDERLWAAAELGPHHRRSRVQRFLPEKLRRVFSQPGLAPGGKLGFGCADGTVDLCPGQAPRVRQEGHRGDSHAHCLRRPRVVERTRANPYRMSMQARDYVWGSNSVAAEYGMYLLIANQFEPDNSFVDAARDNLHYLLGETRFRFRG